MFMVNIDQLIFNQGCPSENKRNLTHYIIDQPNLVKRNDWFSYMSIVLRLFNIKSSLFSARNYMVLSN